MLFQEIEPFVFFFAEEYTDDNIVKLAKRIDDMEGIDIYYRTDGPFTPVLLCRINVYGNPTRFHFYPFYDEDNKYSHLEGI